MANIQEPFKGIAVFLIVTLLTYFAYDNIISGLLDWAVSNSSVVGAIGWVGFVCVYIVSGPVYMFYTFVAGSSGGNTRAGYILAGYSSFFFFLIIAVFINMIFGGVSGSTGLIDALDTTTTAIHGEDWTNVAEISWAAVLVAILGCFGAPFILMLYGFGQIGEEQTVI